MKNTTIKSPGALIVCLILAACGVTTSAQMCEQNYQFQLNSCNSTYRRNFFELTQCQQEAEISYRQCQQAEQAREQQERAREQQAEQAREQQAERAREQQAERAREQQAERAQQQQAERVVPSKKVNPRDFITTVDPKLGTYPAKPAAASEPQEDQAQQKNRNVYQTYKERLDAEAAATQKWIEKRAAEIREQSGKVTEETDQIKKEFIDRSKKLTPEQRQIFNQLQTSPGTDGSSGNQVQLTEEEVTEFAQIKAEQDEYWKRVSNTMSADGWKKLRKAIDKYENGPGSSGDGSIRDKMFDLQKPSSQTNRPIPKGNDEIETVEEKTRREDNEWLQLIKSPHAHYSDEWK